MINLIELNKTNWQECAFLTQEEENKFVAPNWYSIAEAQFHPKIFSKGISLKEKIIGYSMYGEYDEYPNIFMIDRFMIHKDFRKKGYGSQALKKIIEIAFDKNYTRIETSTNPSNQKMQNLLKKIGFITLNEIRDGEVLFFIEKK